MFLGFLVLAFLMVAALAMVLLGLVANRKRAPQYSNRLMRWRVFFQLAALTVFMALLAAKLWSG